MKKILVVLAAAVFAASCGNSTDTKTVVTDSTKVVTDTTKVVTDTLVKPATDTAAAKKDSTAK